MTEQDSQRSSRRTRLAPLHQRLLTWTSYALLGAIVLGEALEIVGLSIALLDRYAYSIAGTIAAFWLAAELVSRFRPIQWVLGDGKVVSVRRLGIRPRLGLLGAILLLLVPRFVPISPYSVPGGMQDNSDATAEEFQISGSNRKTPSVAERDLGRRPLDHSSGSMRGTIGGTSDAMMLSDFGAYLHSLDETLGAAWANEISRETMLHRDLQSTLELEIGRDGVVRHMRVLETSGSAAFDAATKRATLAAAPFPVYGRSRWRFMSVPSCSFAATATATSKLSCDATEPDLSKPIPCLPDYPARLKHYDIPPDYPARARKGRISATVILRVVIDETGAVRKAEVLSETRPNLGFADAAVAAALAWRYEANGEIGCYRTVNLKFAP